MPQQLSRVAHLRKKSAAAASTETENIFLPSVATAAAAAASGESDKITERATHLSNF